MNLFMRTKIFGASADEYVKTVKRARKYIDRLNYMHFSQFDRPLETMSMADYVAIMGNEDPGQI